MSLDVYINGQLLELNKNKAIGLTYQIGSILNPGSRAGNLSNKFKVPKSRNNTEILGNLSNINSSTNIPYQRNSAKIVQDGIELFPDGFAVIDSTDSDYGVTVYSGNVSFFDLIKGKNINELDWSSSDHRYDIPTILASFNGGLDYIYPIVDWGKGTEFVENVNTGILEEINFELLDNTDTQVCEALFPCPRISAVVGKIVSELGYTLKGSFKDTDQYKRLLLTLNNFGYSKDQLASNTGVAKEVSVVDDLVLVENLSLDTSAFEKDIPLFYNDIEWDRFNSQMYTPDNDYFGEFNLSVKGDIRDSVPVLGEFVINSDASSSNDRYENYAINDDYVSYMEVVGGVDNRLIVYDIANKTEVIVESVTGGSVFSIVSMTKTNGGYVAYCLTNPSGMIVKLYEIATGINTDIYTDPTGGSSIVDYLEVENGRVAWGFKGLGVDGVWMYDIATGVTKIVTSSSDINPASERSITHNGEYLIWDESVLNQAFLFDFATGSNIVIDNFTGGSSIRRAEVLGDYFTYGYGGPEIPRSYKISTGVLTLLPLNVGDSVTGSDRYGNLIAYGGQNDVLYLYDLSTNIGGPTLETSAEINGNDYISINEDYIAYSANSLTEVRVYEISTGTITTVSTSNSEQKRNVILGKNNIVFYTNGINANNIRYYDIDNSSFFPNVSPLANTDGFVRSLNNSRVLYNVRSSGLDTDNRIAYIDPIKNVLSTNYEIQIREDGVVIYSEIVIPSVLGVYSNSIDTGTITVKSGSEYKAFFIVTALRDNTISYPIKYSLSLSSFSFTAKDGVPYGAKLNFASTLDWGQSQVLTDLMNQYSLTIQTNEVTKELFLNPLDDLNDNLSKAIDWSDKIDLSKAPSVKYKIGRYSQENSFNYRKDEDVLEDFGQGFIYVNDLSLALSSTLITLHSVAVESGIRVVDRNTPTIPFVESFDGLSKGSFKKKKARHILLDPEDTTLNLTSSLNSDTGSENSNIPFCYFKKSSKRDSLDFESLIDENYNVLKGMLDQVKFVSAGFILSELDVSNLNFTTPRYLDVHYDEIHINGYFYINKVSNFKQNSSTKVDLIRL